MKIKIIILITAICVVFKCEAQEKFKLPYDPIDTSFRMNGRCLIEYKDSIHNLKLHNLKLNRIITSKYDFDVSNRKIILMTNDFDTLTIVFSKSFKFIYKNRIIDEQAFNDSIYTDTFIKNMANKFQLVVKEYWVNKIIKFSVNFDSCKLEFNFRASKKREFYYFGEGRNNNLGLTMDFLHNKVEDIILVKYEKNVIYKIRALQRNRLRDIDCYYRFAENQNILTKTNYLRFNIFRRLTNISDYQHINITLNPPYSP